MSARVKPNPLRALTLVALVAATASGLVGCGAGVPASIEAPPPSDGERRVYARQSLIRARQLRLEGRIEAAERSTRRGLDYEPENARLHRLRSELLEALGRTEEAALHRRRADALDPPPLPLPSTPLRGGGAGLLFALLPNPPAPLAPLGAASRVPRDWPQGEVAQTLVSRLRIRLPEASVELLPSLEHPTSESISGARSWLAEMAPRAVVSLRVERAFCGSSIKDGEFALGWLRLATAGGAPPPPGAAGSRAEERARSVRHVVEDARGAGCRSEAVARALEESFAEPAIQELLALPATGGPASFRDREIRDLFPELDRRIHEELHQARRLLSLGLLGASADALRRAAAIDPRDPEASVLLQEVEGALSISRQLSALESASAPEIPPEFLEPSLTAPQRRALEAQLAHEKRTREQLLAALAVLGETRAPPSRETLAALRGVELSDRAAVGPTLARVRTGDPEADVAARVLMAPDGEIVARYYFTQGGDRLLLREDDADGDGRPDRWLGYEGDVPREIWEAAEGGGLPVLHMVYTRDGGFLERIEIDRDRNGRPERELRYADGRLALEAWDRDGDGRFDRFQHFDAAGSLTLREEDLDADGVADVRTLYRRGRVARREITNPELLDNLEREARQPVESGPTR